MLAHALIIISIVVVANAPVGVPAAMQPRLVFFVWHGSKNPQRALASTCADCKIVVQRSLRNPPLRSSVAGVEVLQIGQSTLPISVRIEEWLQFEHTLKTTIGKSHS